MGETGILADDPRIELIAGAVVVREPWPTPRCASTGA
jgi:hypothetical protein